MDIISLLITILVLCLVFGVVYYIITLIPLPAPFAQIALIVLALIFLLVLLNEVGFLGGRPLLYRHQ
jgi:hypothetical protein